MDSNAFAMAPMKLQSSPKQQLKSPTTQNKHTQNTCGSQGRNLDKNRITCGPQYTLHQSGS